MSARGDLLIELKSGLPTMADERVLLDLMDRSLARLRVMYRVQKADFPPDSIEFLRSLRCVQAELRTFMDLLEEKDDIRTREDAEELTACLQGDKENLEPHFISSA
jgi:hypothetical protein